MTYDDIPFDYEDDRQFLSDKEEQYNDDCLERAEDMRQELRGLSNEDSKKPNNFF